ncbi:hypothetical protein C8R47DRAFT_1206789 [Mycena vitilis]|nr:hypothetical protein C8R47DRAFT_1206789 [Mycena vitilis]
MSIPLPALITTEGCPNWPADTANGNYAFHACYDFLKSTSPSRFREIGSLAGFLLAADFSYAGMVQPPTATEVEEIIRSINKGGVRGLELLGLVFERPHGNGRAFKMRNADKIKAAFCRLYGFLDNKLSAAQKLHIVFDAIMTENSLCRAKRDGFEARARSWEPLSGLEDAVREDGIVAAGCGHGPNSTAPETALWNVDTVDGASTTNALGVPADPHAHGPSLGWLPGMFRGASFGSGGPDMPVLVLFALVLAVGAAAWICVWKPVAFCGLTGGSILSGNTSALGSLTTVRRPLLMNAWDKFHPLSMTFTLYI